MIESFPSINDASHIEKDLDLFLATVTAFLKSRSPSFELLLFRSL